jgi:hypothetical protein
VRSTVSDKEESKPAREEEFVIVYATFLVFIGMVIGCSDTSDYQCQSFVY